MKEIEKKYALILGATSDIGRHIAMGLANRGFQLYLTGRNQNLLSEIKNEILKTSIKEISTFQLDISEYTSHKSFYDSLIPKPELVFCCIGYYEDQLKARIDFADCLTTINVNYTGVVSILNLIANDFEERKIGRIITLSSVAGERGRQLNYLYGSTKAALTVYLSGLRNRLYKANVSVTSIILGPVYTKMSEGHNLVPWITLKPEIAADKIIEAGLKNKNVVFIFWPWRFIMLIIRLIPEFIFKRLGSF